MQDRSWDIRLGIQLHGLDVVFIYSLMIDGSNLGVGSLSVTC